MSKIIIFCSGAKHLIKKFKKDSNTGENFIEIFPDGEFNQNFSPNLKLKGKTVFIVQSIYRDEEYSVNDRLFEALTAYYNAKSLGAKKIYLIAPYFSYLRQDKMFKQNQAISAKIIAKLFSVFNNVFIFEPHLHRFKKFLEYFPNAKRVSLNDFILPEIRKIKKNSKRILVIGPDSESLSWVKPMKEELGLNFVIMTKKRLGPRNVEMHINKSYVVDSVIIIDDIISTGKTILKCLDNVICKKTFVFAFHGVFTDKKAINKLKNKAKLTITNTLLSKEKGIKILDISNKIKQIIKEN